MKLLYSIFDLISVRNIFKRVFLSDPQFVWARTLRTCNDLLHFVLI